MCVRVLSSARSCFKNRTHRGFGDMKRFERLAHHHNSRAYLSLASSLSQLRSSALSLACSFCSAWASGDIEATRAATSASSASRCGERANPRAWLRNGACTYPCVELVSVSADMLPVAWARGGDGISRTQSERASRSTVLAR